MLLQRGGRWLEEALVSSAVQLTVGACERTPPREFHASCRVDPAAAMRGDCGFLSDGDSTAPLPLLQHGRALNDGPGGRACASFHSADGLTIRSPSHPLPPSPREHGRPFPDLAPRRPQRSPPLRLLRRSEGRQRRRERRRKRHRRFDRAYVLRRYPDPVPGVLSAQPSLGLGHHADRRLVSSSRLPVTVPPRRESLCCGVRLGFALLLALRFCWWAGSPTSQSRTASAFGSTSSSSRRHRSSGCTSTRTPCSSAPATATASAVGGRVGQRCQSAAAHWFRWCSHHVLRWRVCVRKQPPIVPHGQVGSTC